MNRNQVLALVELRVEIEINSSHPVPRLISHREEQNKVEQNKTIELEILAGFCNHIRVKVGHHRTKVKARRQTNKAEDEHKPMNKGNYACIHYIASSVILIYARNVRVINVHAEKIQDNWRKL